MQTTLKQVLGSQPWDIVYFQQLSWLTGDKTSYTLSDRKSVLDQFTKFTRANCPNAQVRTGFLMTWACKNNCQRPQYRSLYHGNQSKMFFSHLLGDPVNDIQKSLCDFLPGYGNSKCSNTLR